MTDECQPVAAIPAADKEIPVQLQRLDDKIDRLFELVDELNRRFDPVISAAVVVCNEDNPDNPEISTTVGRSLYIAVDRIDTIGARLIRLLEGCEL